MTASCAPAPSPGTDKPSSCSHTGAREARQQWECRAAPYPTPHPAPPSVRPGLPRHSRCSCSSLGLLFHPWRGARQLSQGFPWPRPGSPLTAPSGRGPAVCSPGLWGPWPATCLLRTWSPPPLRGCLPFACCASTLAWGGRAATPGGLSQRRGDSHLGWEGRVAGQGPACGSRSWALVSPVPDSPCAWPPPR